MQVVRVSNYPKALEADSTSNPELEQEKKTEEALDGFFGYLGGDKNGQPAQPAIDPNNPFAPYLTAKASVAEGATEVSSQNFAPTDVPELEYILNEQPRLKAHLEALKRRYGKILQILKKRIENWKGLWESPTARAEEKLAAKEKWTEAEAAKVKAFQQIEKIDRLSISLAELWQREKIFRADLDRDGWIGKPWDRENSLKVLADGTIVDPKLGKPVKQTFLNENYQWTISRSGLALEETPELGAGGTEADLYLKLDKYRPTNFDHQFNAQIEIALPEWIWVKKGEDGKPLRSEAPGRWAKFEAKLPKVTSKGHGDNVTHSFTMEPPTEAERGEWMQVKVAKVEIKSERVKQSGELAKVFHHHLTFRDREGKILFTMRVAGTAVSHGAIKAAPGNYYAASTAGFTLTAGFDVDGDGKEDLQRLSSVEVDASQMTSTGRTIQAAPGGDPADFYRQLGLQFEMRDGKPYLQGFNDEKGAYVGKGDKPLTNFYDSVTKAKEIKEGPEVSYKLYEDPNADRGQMAHEYNLVDGFLTAKPETAKPETGKPEGEDFSAQYAGVSTVAYTENNALKTGINLNGLRGVLKGTSFNDITVFGKFDLEALKEFMPEGAPPPEPGDAAYSNVGDGKSGRDIFIAKDVGDVFLRNVSFAWIESHREITALVETSITGGRDAATLSKGNRRVFVKMAGEIASDPSGIVNHDDSDPKIHTQGIKDDFFDVPAGIKFANPTNDIPGHTRDTGLATDQIAAKDVANAVTEMTSKIRNEAINRYFWDSELEDPQVLWEFGPEYEKEKVWLDEAIPALAGALGAKEEGA